MEKSDQNQYRAVLVALDLSEMDDSIIRYVSMMSKILPFEQIYFAHIVKSLELPGDLLKSYPDLMAPLDESIQYDIEKKVSAHFKGSPVKIDYLIQEGSPIDTLLKISRVKATGLIVMGRKKTLDGSGIVTSNIARMCPCSLLLVPEMDQMKIKHILLPIDFSNHSLIAINKAMQFKVDESVKISCVNVYEVPLGFYKTGKSYKEFGEIMKGHAKKDFEQFVKTNNLLDTIECHYLLTNDGKQAELIYEKASEMGVDMVIIGSKGRTLASSILMGSLAERIVYRDHDIPMLIVKKNGENMGFLETFLRL